MVEREGQPSTRTERSNSSLPYQGEWVRGAEQIINEFSRPEDIDRLVEFLRSKNYSRRFTRRRPLLAYDKPLPIMLQSGARRGVLKSNNLGSALWNDDFTHYNGTTKNLTAELLDPNTIKKLSHATRYINYETVVAFRVTGDIVSYDQGQEGQVKKTYALYLSPAKVDPYSQVRKSLKEALDQAALFYPYQEIARNRLLWLNSHTDNYQEVTQIIKQNQAIFNARTNAVKSIERFRKTHPEFGGLPTLGKDR